MIFFIKIAVYTAHNCTKVRFYIKNIYDWILVKIAWILITLLLIACAGTPEIQPTRGIGWISDDAFRVKAAGVAKYEVADLQLRKQQALQAAMLMARFIVFEEFTATIADDVIRLPRREILKRVKSEFAFYVKEGNAVDVKYDGNGICTVLFEIRGRGIRQKFFALRNRLIVESR